MKVGSVRGHVNYAGTAATETVHKIAKNPSAVKKIFQVATKAFALIDITYRGLDKPQDRKLTDAMKGTVDVIDFYGTFKNAMFWINPFSKETLDREALADSLRSTLCAPIINTKQHALQEQRSAKIVQEVLKREEFFSKSEVREALVQSLQKSGYKSKAAHELADKIVIRQKARPITLLFSMVCFTTVDFIGNVLTLRKWGVIDLTKLGAIAAKIGSESRVFMFVINLGVETALGTIASAGLIVVVGEASVRAILQAIKIYQSKEPKELEAAYKELRKAITDIIAGTVDLAATALPLLFALNPPVVLGLAIFAKGTGLIIILFFK